MAVTNIWHVLNLRESPFFQAELEAEGRYPTELFVGRRDEIDYVLAGIGGAPDSRHAIQGPPGVGKTTLVNRIKAELGADGYVVAAEPVSVTSASDADELRLQILTRVHDALVARDTRLADLPSMRTVRQLLAAERTRSWGVSLGVPQVASGGLSGGETRSTGPGALTVRPAPLLRELARIVGDPRLEAPGIVVHLNNLENVADAAQDEAARVVRDLRDTGLRYDGLHYILAGTDDAVQTIVASQEQLRSVFGNPGSLQPLSEAELDRLLALRYDHLRHFDDRPWRPPVESEAVHRLHRLFAGNLRGTLHALDESAKVLVGHGERPTDPMDFARMQPVLRRVYETKVRSDLEAQQREQLAAVAARGATAVVTQAAMTRPFGLEATTTLEALKALKRQGYLVEVPPVPTGRRGRPPRTFALSGSARLAFGLFA